MKIGLYILKCSNNRYYVGSTNDIERRLGEHENGLVKATQHILPIKLSFFQECDSLLEARKLEYKLKSKKSRLIIETIIREGIIRFKRP